jgi:hypothetical protein
MSFFMKENSKRMTYDVPLDNKDRALNHYPRAKKALLPAPTDRVLTMNTGVYHYHYLHQHCYYHHHHYHPLSTAV